MLIICDTEINLCANFNKLCHEMKKTSQFYCILISSWTDSGMTRNSLLVYQININMINTMRVVSNRKMFLFDKLQISLLYKNVSNTVKHTNVQDGITNFWYKCRAIPIIFVSKCIRNIVYCNQLL